MKEVIVNELNLEKIDLLDKLIESSEFMEEVLKETFNLEFKSIEGKEDWKYNAPFWMINEDLETYSSVSSKNVDFDKYTTKITINSSQIITFDKITLEKEKTYIKYYLDFEERFIPDRNETPQNILLAYLKNKLVDNDGDWRMFGPKSLIHDKTDDKILVYVRPDTFHIVHDGECVIDNFSIEHFGFHPSEVDEDMLNNYLQDILAHF